MRNPIILVTLAFLAGRTIAAPIAAYPQQDQKFTQSLAGKWPFKYIAGLKVGAEASFSTPGYDTSAWKTIKVPGNWENQGFAEPHYYLDLQDGLGLYRHAFRVPAGWRKGRRVCLRFEGVAYAFDAWVNGVKVGSSAASAFNPTTLDITDALSADPTAENVLAIQVTTKPIAWQSDVYDDWDLSGIFRAVTAFSVPENHMQDVTAQTHLTSDGAADLSVDVAVSQPDGEVQGRLLAPDGGLVQEFALPRAASGHCAAVVHVAKPQLWTAETPSLYRLQLTLSAQGQPLQKVVERIGLREVSIVNKVLQLNGHPIKLHGVDRHDEAPEVGRATTEQDWQRDLAIMKKGNVNFVRTSHYPPNSRFLKLCDEMGIYVLCEVPLAHFQDGQKNNPAYHDAVFARVDATINRDKDHASVIIWSIGNENKIADLLFDAGRRAKALDPTRPICYPTVGSYFDKNWKSFPDFVDIYSPHYPSMSMLRRFARDLPRPMILTEYAHANGLAADRIQDEWGILQSTPTFAGGAIWHLMDQGLLETSDQPVDPKKPAMDVWLDPHRHYDTHGLDGEDGITYADRTPQTDFWEMRKVYAPVQIEETSAAVQPGAQKIAVTVENRYDFRSLNGCQLNWTLQRNGEVLDQGSLSPSAAAHEKETLSIPVEIPAKAAGDVLTLNLRCVDQSGWQINERTIRLDLPDAHRDAWLSALPGVGAPKVTQDETAITIKNPQWTLKVMKTTGELTIADPAGKVIVAGIYPRASRKLTQPEQLRIKHGDLWVDSTLKELTAPVVKVETPGDRTTLSVSGTYPRSDKREQSFVGGYQVEIAANGTLAFSYDYVPTSATGMLPEAGLSIVLPTAFTEFRWIGQGPYAGYPGKDRLDEFGLFHLNADDLYFRGNRRETELALLTTATGHGLALATTPGDVAVERVKDQLILGHNAVISGLGNKAGGPEVSVNADKTPHVAGHFTLLPLGRTWPTALTRWFGDATDVVKPFKPFYRSYDQ
ncbi:MAG: glycoside hydrolase family 2 TIM barrel-domain containing protein [Chthoniobacteraceae bacterium]